jgi:hypothetical protein
MGQPQLTLADTDDERAVIRIVTGGGKRSGWQRSRLSLPRAALMASSFKSGVGYAGGPAVNRLVAGSNPARGAKFFKRLAQAAGSKRDQKSLRGYRVATNPERCLI